MNNNSPAQNEHTLYQVALPVPLRTLFSYLDQRSNAEHLERHIEVGDRVRVPFRNQELIGVVVAINNDIGETAPEKLKSIIEAGEPFTSVPAELLRLLQWVSNYYQHPIGETVLAALPPYLRQQCAAPQVLYWRHTIEGKGLAEDALKRSKKQQEIHQYLLAHQHFSVTDSKTLGFSASSLKALADKGLIEKADAVPEGSTLIPSSTSRSAYESGNAGDTAGEVFAVTSTTPPTSSSINSSTSSSESSATNHRSNSILRVQALTLNEEQESALKAVQFHRFKPYLLHGITGSGKTEIYLQLVAHALSIGKQALVLVPEIGLSPQTLERFRVRFSVQLVELHSGVSEAQRALNWLAVRNGDAKVVIGTRLAALCPLKEPGIIIVDEEHDISYKQQDGVRYSARDACIVRAQFNQIPVILGSATPSLETLKNAADRNYEHLILKTRATGVIPPKIECIDLKEQPLAAGLSPAAFTALEQSLARGEQSLVFLNRRGFAPMQLCHACGWVATCPNCSVNMTLHQHPARLHCHHCDRRSAAYKTCSHCGSHELDTRGVGTEQVESELLQRFPNYPVIRVDRDTTRSKKAFQAALDEINQGNPAILIGTQMLAKGHHFANLRLVLVADTDQGFLNPDYRATEKMGQLLMQVAGRAGRENTQGLVLLQTHRSDHPLLQTLLNQGYFRFATELLALRHSMKLPPYWHAVLFRAESKRAENAMQLLELIKRAYFREYPPEPGVNILGPMPAAIERVQDRYRFQLQITANARQKFKQVLPYLIGFIEQQALSKRVRWSIDVDPVES